MGWRLVVLKEHAPGTLWPSCDVKGVQCVSSCSMSCSISIWMPYDEVIQTVKTATLLNVHLLQIVDMACWKINFVEVIQGAEIKQLRQTDS
jgi:hypothetical protein